MRCQRSRQEVSGCSQAVRKSGHCNLDWEAESMNSNQATNTETSYEKGLRLGLERNLEVVAGWWWSMPFIQRQVG